MAQLGQILCRIVVPAWIITGAALKLLEIDPGTLPGKTIAPVIHAIPAEPVYVLAVIVGLELALAAIMITLATVARPMAIGVLSIYCMITFGEMVQGNTAGSGCFGANSLTPITMLAINGALLLAVCAFDLSSVVPVSAANLARVAAVTLVAASFFVSFKVVLDAEGARNQTRAMAADATVEDASLQMNLAAPTGTQRLAAPAKR